MPNDFTLKIDGVSIPAPSAYSYTEADLTVNAQRNANGYANWDIVRKNVGHMNLTWNAISRQEIAQISGAIRNKKSFNVTFLNTLTGTIETRKFYAGDRATEMVRYLSALDYWPSLTVPFVEV